MVTQHRVTGMLFQAERGLVLHVDGGGEWELDAGRAAWKLIGQRVIVVGVRSGFNGLDVTSMSKAE